MSCTWLRQVYRRWLFTWVLFTAVTLFVGACSPKPQTGGIHLQAGTAAAKTVAVILQTQAAAPTATWTIAPQPSQIIPSATQTSFPAGTTTETTTPVASTALPTDTTVPENTPASSPTPRIPLADIRIMKPGSLSKVTSPISLEASAIPGPGGQVHIDLIGEDGQAISRQVIAYNSPRGQRVGVALKLEFEIPRVAATARLQVSVTDTDARITALASVNLILLSVGEPEINLPGDQSSPFVFSQPAAGQSVKGGVIQVSGLVRPVSSHPLQFDLV
ncbi:MAG: hypothetical protein PHQ40_14990, partial [Anaerolineaceae bacterium]|nr:hypothetical protein [Anaerolineaceae bacterium]